MPQSPEFRRFVRIAASMNKRAAAAGAYGEVGAETLMAVAMLAPGCAYCGIELGLMSGMFDHVIPLERGGRNTATNLVRSCLRCNRKKFTKTPTEFAESLVLERVCPVDGKRFVPRWGEVQAGRGVVCSRSCAAKWRFDPRRETWASQ